MLAWQRPTSLVSWCIRSEGRGGGHIVAWWKGRKRQERRKRTSFQVWKKKKRIETRNKRDKLCRSQPGLCLALLSYIIISAWRRPGPHHWCMHVCVVIDPRVLAVNPNKRRNDEGMWSSGYVSQSPPWFTLNLVIKCLSKFVWGMFVAVWSSLEQG